MVKIWLHTLLTSGGLALVAFLTSVLTARALGPEGRGLLASVMLLVTLATGIAQFGLGQALIFLARSDPNWKARSFFLGSAVFVIFAAVALTTAGVAVSERFHTDLVVPTVLLGSGLAFSGFTVVSAQIEKELIRYNLFRVFVPLGVFVGVGLVWSLSHLSVQSVVLLHSASAWLAASLAFVWLWRFFPPVPTIETSVNISSKRLVQYVMLAVKYHGTALLGLALNNLDKVYFFLVGGLREFGLYSVAYGLSRLLGTAQDAVSTSLFARFAGTDGKQLTSATLRAFRLTFMPLMAVATVLAVFAEPLLTAAFGHSFAAAALPFALLLYESVIAGSGWILAQQFNAQGKPGLVLLRQVSSVLPLLLLLPFIPSEGLGVSLAALLLVGSLIRLLVTMLIYRWVGLETPRVFPTKDDLRLLLSLTRK